MSHPLPFPRLKRNALRKARRRIAEGSILGQRETSATHTRQFPVEGDVSDNVWSISREASTVLRSLADNSIFAMVVRLHDAGWRFFASGGERDAFILGQLADSASFDAAALAAMGDDAPKMSASALRDVLSKAPRKVGPETTKDVLYPRLAKALGVSSEDLVWLTTLTRDLVEAFPTWNALKVADGEVGAAVDASLKASGFKLPSLSGLWGVALPDTPKAFGRPTLAFDPSIAVAPATDSTRTRFVRVMARLIREAGGPTEGVSKSVQAAFTTSNANALSWLLGVGRRSVLEHEAPEVAAALGVSVADTSRAVGILQRELQALPDLDALGKRIYVEARAATGGSMDSVTAIYILRVLELHQKLAPLRESIAEGRPAFALPEGLAQADDVFDGLPFSHDSLSANAVALDAEVEKTGAALDLLLGLTEGDGDDYQAAIDTVEAFGDAVSRLDATVRTVNARIDGLVKEGFDTRPKLTPLLGDERWTKLVAFQDREPEAAVFRPILEQRLQALLDEGEAAFATLHATHPMSMKGALQAETARVREDLEMARRRGRLSDDAVASADVPALASRWLLDRVVRAVRTCTGNYRKTLVAELVRQGLVKLGAVSEKTLLAHLHSNECRIAWSALSRPQRPVMLIHDGLLRFDPEALISVLEDEAKTDGQVRDVVLFRFCREAMLLQSLPMEIDAKSVVAIAAVTEESPAKVPWVDLRSDAATVARSEVIKAYNARFHSTARGLLFRLQKTRWIESWALNCWSGPTAMFIPKDGDWTLPAQYRVGRFGEVLAATDWQEKVAAGPVNALAFCKDLATYVRKNAGTPVGDDALQLMSQAPHRWGVACDLEGAVAVEGAIVSDGKLDSWVKRSALLLTPPRHWAGELLAAFKGAKLSPHSMTFEREFERNGKEITELSRRMVVNIPIAQTLTPSDAWEPQAVMGIDLNEAELGIVVHDIATGEETPLRIPLRKTYLLAKSEQRYRERQQPRQQFRANYSRAAEDAIKAAIGEACSLIDNVMVHYDAIPVFEFGITRARASNAYVRRVYAGVVQRYAFIVGNQAANTIRQSHWFGASRWSYPAVGMDVAPEARTAPKRLEKMDADKVFRPAMGFPGVLVSGYLTSRICSDCGVDALGAFDAAIDNGQRTFSTNGAGEGVLSLPDGELRIRIEQPTQNKSTQRAARARNRRAPWEVIPNRSWDLGKKGDRQSLATLIKRGMRRPKAEVAGRQTKFGQFHCANVACQAVQSSETNAAANISRRYLERTRTLGDACNEWGIPDRRAEHAERLRERLQVKERD